MEELNNLIQDDFINDFSDYYTDEKVYSVVLKESGFIDYIDMKKLENGIEVSEEVYLQIMQNKVNFYENGEFIYKPEIMELSFNEFKEKKLSEIETSFKNAMSNLDKTPDEERLTFERQEREAREYLASNDESKAPFLKALATSREVPLNDLAQKVVAKANLYANASATLIGKRQKCLDELKKATTKEELERISFE
ncbi:MULTISPECIES: hypothetical protein [unclassified Campylobacter]|uniref:hypothetical protein n=1 Tax=unclassified Campylobacter TaxID=2593542 RepID=UPI001EFB92EC|nr:hypothetical protein [Campylobacter sp. RM12651]MBZ7976706.1 hypothetical protein [Campylobacter sp. RM12637]ULO02925.1 hypothetical protein AVBRAN_0455 [Campylobacter sp. RM12651]